MEEAWLTNHMFWCGKSYYWIENGRILGAPDPTSPDSEETRYRNNMIRARLDVAVAKVLSVNAAYQARPKSGAARDLWCAEMTNKVFAHIRSTSDWDQTQLISTYMKGIYGSAIIKTYWDPNKGEPTRYYWNDARSRTVIPDAMLTPEDRAQKEAAGHFEDLSPGDVAHDVIAPFGFFCDSAARDKGIEGAQWCAERHYVDIDVIAARWGVDPKTIQPMEPDQGLSDYQEWIAFMSSGFGSPMLDLGRPMDKLGKVTLYIELWQRPNKEFKKGLRVVVAGGRVLNAGNTNNPYLADRTGWAHLPYRLDLWKPHPGRLWGVSAVEDALVPQYYQNKTKGAMIDFVAAHGQPSTFVGADSGIDTDNMTTRVGRVYKVNEASAKGVQVGPTPQMPHEVMQVVGMTAADVDTAMSQSEISGGKLPGQVRSGSGIRMINEERFAGLTVPVQMTVRTVRDTGRVALAIAKLYYGKKREMRYLGEDNEWVAEAFDGADLVNDLVIVGEPDVADSIAGQRETMMNAVEAGAFNPQFDRATRTQILRGLKLGTNDEFFTRQLQASNSQQREIEMMIADPTRYVQRGFPVLPWEDHESEMAECVAFMYRPEFKKLDPLTQGIITQHWAAHQQQLQMQQMAQLQMIEATKGAPGQSGQASQPATASKR